MSDGDDFLTNLRLMGRTGVMAADRIEALEASLSELLDTTKGYRAAKIKRARALLGEKR